MHVCAHLSFSLLSPLSPLSLSLSLPFPSPAPLPCARAECEKTEQAGTALRLSPPPPSAPYCSFSLPPLLLLTTSLQRVSGRPWGEWAGGPPAWESPGLKSPGGGPTFLNPRDETRPCSGLSCPL